jgi:hypothetical protein
MLKWTTHARLLIPIVLVYALAAHAQDQKQGQGKDKDKAKQPPAQTVDSGSFGVFIKGQRVVTETFSVQQQSGLSIIKSHLKDASGTATNEQSSEMQIMPNAQLVRYEWDETIPAVSSLVVTPNNEFLIEKITTATSAKPAEQPFLMPNTSMILDNNFFVHREVLLWRYLAADCHPEGGNFQCQKGPVEFGVLVPQDRTSMRVRLELVGKEKVNIRGAERELLRLNLSGDGFNWALWVDDHDQFKLMRVAIPADNTEVVRD